MLGTASLPALFAEFGRNSVEAADRPPEPLREDGWRRAVDRLLEFWNWTDDWDGEGTAAPNRDAIRGAITLIRELSELAATTPAAGGHFLDNPPDRLLPGRDGEIVVEWRFPQRGYAEIEVVSATEANGMLVFADGRPTMFDTIRISPRGGDAR